MSLVAILLEHSWDQGASPDQFKLIQRQDVTKFDLSLTFPLILMLKNTPRACSVNCACVPTFPGFPIPGCYKHLSFPTSAPLSLSLDIVQGACLTPLSDCVSLQLQQLPPTKPCYAFKFGAQPHFHCSCVQGPWYSQ